jgi:hypothetical protein
VMGASSGKYQGQIKYMHSVCNYLYPTVEVLHRCVPASSSVQSLKKYLCEVSKASRSIYVRCPKPQEVSM